MSVSSVNNSNNNAGAYAATAAVVGGGAAGAYGYFSRPFLKDGIPTDKFLKTANEYLKKELPEEGKQFLEAMENEGKALDDLLKNAKSVDEFKENLINKHIQNITNENIDDVKLMANSFSEALEKVGVKTSQEFSEVTSVDEVKKFFRKSLDKGFAGKTLDDIKQAVEVEGNILKKTIFEQYWDTSKKKFVDDLDDYGKSLKKAAQNIQLKTAGIYGGIAAAVLGLGTYLCCAGKKAPETAPEQNVDTQA